VGDFLTNTDDLLEDPTEIAKEIRRKAMQSLKICIDAIGPDNHIYPEGMLWRQALYRSILPHQGHIGCDQNGQFHCNTCSEYFQETAIGYMLLLAEAGYAHLAGQAEGSSTGILVAELVEYMWRYFHAAPNSSEPWPEFLPEDVGETMDPDRVAYFKKAFSLALSGPSSSDTSFFVTANGFYGISDASVQRGDEICILLECPVPLLIRRVDLRLVVVGDCYVFGMMYGEMTERVESGELKLQTFRFH
jgi:hypothetical protein